MRLIEEETIQRAELFRRIMHELIGEDVVKKNRKWSVSAARAMVSYRLIEEGCKLLDVAQLMQRHHATILYHLEMVDNMLTSPGYKAEKELFKKFKREINEYDKSKNRAFYNQA